MCKFMYNISTVSSVSVEVVNKIKFEFSKKKKKKKEVLWLYSHFLDQVCIVRHTLIV